MCDYSIINVKSRPAQIGDKLTTRNFGTGTHGFAASEDTFMAVCLLPGTELSFDAEVTCLPIGMFARRGRAIPHKTAIFRQVNEHKKTTHHDALEFPDGQVVLLTCLDEGQRATVLQLPTVLKSDAKIEVQRRIARVAYVG